MLVPRFLPAANANGAVSFSDPKTDQEGRLTICNFHDTKELRFPSLMVTRSKSDQEATSCSQAMLIIS